LFLDQFEKAHLHNFHDNEVIPILSITTTKEFGNFGVIRMKQDACFFPKRNLRNIEILAYGMPNHLVLLTPLDPEPLPRKVSESHVQKNKTALST